MRWRKGRKGDEEGDEGDEGDEGEITLSPHTTNPITTQTLIYNAETTWKISKSLTPSCESSRHVHRNDEEECDEIKETVETIDKKETRTNRDIPGSEIKQTGPPRPQRSKKRNKFEKD